MYKYNKDKIAEFAEERKLTPHKMASRLNMVNPKGPRGWLIGGDLRVSSLLHFVNTFGLDLLDFFSLDDNPLSEVVKEQQQTAPSTTISTTVAEAELRCAQRIAELEKQYLREIMELKIELAKK